MDGGLALVVNVERKVVRVAALHHDLCNERRDVRRRKPHAQLAVRIRVKVFRAVGVAGERAGERERRHLVRGLADLEVDGEHGLGGGVGRRGGDLGKRGIDRAAGDGDGRGLAVAIAPIADLLCSGVGRDVDGSSGNRDCAATGIVPGAYAGGVNSAVSLDESSRNGNRDILAVANVAVSGTDASAVVPANGDDVSAGDRDGHVLGLMAAADARARFAAPRRNRSARNGNRQICRGRRAADARTAISAGIARGHDLAAGNLDIERRAVLSAADGGGIVAARGRHAAVGYLDGAAD